MNDKIVIKGAREHNLKNISIEIPKNQFVVITGVSGSGKSSLDGVDVRTILKVKKLYDVSLVVWPAYEDTEAAKRSFDQFKEDGEKVLSNLAKRKLQLRKLEL